MNARCLALFASLWFGCASAPRAASVAEGAPPASVTPPDDSEVRTVTRAEWVALLEPPEAALQEGRFIPVHGTSGRSGFRAYGLRFGRLFARLGLVNGDLVYAVNGLPLASTDDARAAARALVAADRIVVSVERAGVDRELRVLVTP